MSGAILQPIPEQMSAIEISAPGGPEVLRPVLRPVPQPGAGEVLIKVAASGINRPDVFQRLGQYPPPPGASDIPGLEVAGEIASLGPEVADWRVGDPVCALVAGGGYAEYCVAPALQCLPLPPGVTVIAAAGLPETVFTVWANLFDRAGLKPGEVVLIHGGAGGIGTTAIQMAAAWGARVFATAGTPEKCGLCERLGAERAIDYKEEDFVAVVRDATDGYGADVVLDMIGGDYLPRNLDLLAPDGRHASIAHLRGAKATVNIRTIMTKRLTLTGSTLRARPLAFKAALARAVQNQVWPMIEAGRLRPLIHATFPLSEAAEAHRALEGGEVSGKLVLRA